MSTIIDEQRIYNLCKKARDNPSYELQPDIEFAIEQVPDGDIYIAFAGSDSAIDWVYNILATKHMHLATGKTVAEGFYMLFQKAIPFIEGVLIPNLKDHMHDNNAIYIGGYSQGAATARFVANQLAHTMKNNIHVITYACPLQADAYWEAEFDLAVASQVNYKHSMDLVGYIPFGFAQPKNVRWLKEFRLCPHQLALYHQTTKVVQQ